MTIDIDFDVPKYVSDGKPRIAIIQTGSWGDNINSTLMLKPLKNKYPESIIDIHTSTLYGSAFENNPYVNQIVRYPATAKNEALHLTILIPDKIKDSGYTQTFAPHPMFNHENWTSIENPQLGTNLINAWVRALEHAKIPYTLPLETVLRLTESEKTKVANYWNEIPKRKKCYLMEIHGESGQSFWSPDWTMKVCRHLLQDESVTLFISRGYDGHDIQDLRKHFEGRVNFVGHLSIRECAGLFNHCHAFFSVSSGLSNACNTNMCRKDIPWFEVTNSDAATSSVIRSEGKVFWHKNDVSAYINELKSRGY